DESRRVRQALASTLAAEVSRLTPAQVNYYVDWIAEPDFGAPTWKKILDGLRSRWAAEKDPDARHEIGQTLVRALRQHGEAAERLAFLHREHREGPEAHRAAYAYELFHALLEGSWSAEHEDEALALLGQLADAGGPARIAALYELTDRSVAGRAAARMKVVE